MQPWASLVVSGQRLIENRTTKPPESMIGEQLAIHAGPTFEFEDGDDIFLRKIYGPTSPPHRRPIDFPLNAVIGVATLDRVIELQTSASAVAHETPPVDRIASWNLGEQARWFFGPFGLVLKDVRALAKPVPCNGSPVYWQLPRDVEPAVREQLRAADG
jgi:hypothetical protein